MLDRSSAVAAVALGRLTDADPAKTSRRRACAISISRNAKLGRQHTLDIILTLL
jgi:hypothetical protein